MRSDVRRIGLMRCLPRWPIRPGAPSWNGSPPRASLPSATSPSRFEISAPAISRHLQVLERAGLIERRIERQWRLVRMRREALKPVESWLTRQHRHWSDALDRLEALAAADTPKRRKS